MSNIRTVYMDVNAALAQALLDLNKPYEIGVAGTNRGIRPRIVARYARDMLAGKWAETNQGIALVGEEGSERLVDGQHRLHALLLAAETNPDITIRMGITKGMDENAAFHIDQGLARLGYDVLAMRNGVKSPRTVAAALRLLYLYDDVPYSWAGWHAVRPTHADLIELFEKHTGIEASLDVCGTKGPLPAGPMLAATHLVIRERPEINMPLFLHGLKTGAELGERSPVLALRNYVLNAQKNGQRREAIPIFGVTIHALNAWIVDDRRYNLRFQESNPFPRLTERQWVSR